MVGRGWTQPGGRPHAEAVALAQAGEAARGATVYVTLEPCAHDSARGPACADLLVAAQPDAGRRRARAIPIRAPTAPASRGCEAAGIAVEVGVGRRGGRSGRWPASSPASGSAGPFVTLKLAMSIDGMIATASGESKWITGEEARAHAHLERARSDMILVGRGTYRGRRAAARRAAAGPRGPLAAPRAADHRRAGRGLDPAGQPAGDPHPDRRQRSARRGRRGDRRRLPRRRPRRPAADLPRADPDRRRQARARRRSALGALADAHGRWRLADTRQLGSDTLQVYERTR